MESYKVAILQVAKVIKDDRISLTAQLKYFEYVKDNIAIVTGAIDQKIEKLKTERQKFVMDFMVAPERIRQLKLYLSGLEKKKNKMLIGPKIEKIRMLQMKLKALNLD